MAITVIPYIPRTITVHTGPANQWAENVTVSFPDYIKIVASSEIYPTWPEAALRANILAQISFALNRVYTEYYHSRGYDFDITGSTMNDQRFIKGRSTFEKLQIFPGIETVQNVLLVPLPQPPAGQDAAEPVIVTPQPL